MAEKDSSVSKAGLTAEGAGIPGRPFLLCY
jgi:hypothetical protein